MPRGSNSGCQAVSVDDHSDRPIPLPVIQLRVWVTWVYLSGQSLSPVVNSVYRQRDRRHQQVHAYRSFNLLSHKGFCRNVSPSRQRGGFCGNFALLVGGNWILPTRSQHVTHLVSRITTPCAQRTYVRSLLRPEKASLEVAPTSFRLSIYIQHLDHIAIGKTTLACHVAFLVFQLKFWLEFSLHFFISCWY